MREQTNILMICADQMTPSIKETMLGTKIFWDYQPILPVSKMYIRRSHDVPHPSRLRDVCPDEHLNRSSETHDVHRRKSG